MKAGLDALSVQPLSGDPDIRYNPGLSFKRAPIVIFPPTPDHAPAGASGPRSLSHEYVHELHSLAFLARHEQHGKGSAREVFGGLPSEELAKTVDELAAVASVGSPHEANVGVRLKGARGDFERAERGLSRFVEGQVYDEDVGFGEGVAWLCEGGLEGRGNSAIDLESLTLAD